MGNHHAEEDLEHAAAQDKRRETIRTYKREVEDLIGAWARTSGPEDMSLKEIRYLILLVATKVEYILEKELK